MKRIGLRILIAVGFCSVALPVYAQKLERAVLAFGSNGGNLTPFWVAREAGLYRHYGLDVDVVFFRGSTIAINALATKEAQFGALGASSAVLASRWRASASTSVRSRSAGIRTVAPLSR